jgi:outer membrane protein assembly factor BamB
MNGFRVATTMCLTLAGTLACTGIAHAGGDAVAYQINIAHNGKGSLPGFKGKLKLLWTKNLGAGAISYPLIADGLVFVTVANTNNYGTQLFALDAATGATVWQQALSGTYFWSNAAYENGQVFVVNYDGLVKAFAAGTGTLNWSAQMPGQYAFSSPPTSQNGLLFLGGSGDGGTVYAVDESNGSVQWTAAVENGDNSSPTLGVDGVYVTYPCQYYKFAPKTGALLWHDDEGCSGGGGKTSVWFKSELFVRDPGEGDFILNAKTGAEAGTFQATPAPTFFALKKVSYGVALASGSLNAFDLSSGSSFWSFTGDGNLTTAPLDIGNYVVEGSGSGNLYVLDQKNGKLVWSANVGAGIPGPDEQNVSQPLTGLGAADGVLVVPAGSQISAFAPQ